MREKQQNRGGTSQDEQRVCWQIACAKVTLEFNRRVREEAGASSLLCEHIKLAASPPC